MFRMLIVCAVFCSAVALQNSATAGGMVSITFDDSPVNVYTNARSVMEQYGVTPTLYVIPGSTNDTPSWHMSWSQIKELQALGWDIGSHSLSHRRLTELGYVDMMWEIVGSKMLLRLHGIDALTFASPYGEHDESIRSAIMNFYSSHRGTWYFNRNNGVQDVAKFDPSALAALGVTKEQSADDIINLIKEVERSGQWLILCFHEIVIDEPMTEYQYRLSELERILKFISTNGIKTVTVSEMRKLQ